MLAPMRPCGNRSSLGAAIQSSKTPSALVFSRQGMQQQERDEEQVASIARGGYILKDCSVSLKLFSLRLARKWIWPLKPMSNSLKKRRKARVVSMPSTNVFDIQSAEYKESVLPANVTRRVAIEAGITDFWLKYVGLNGEVIGMTTFGESAPAGDLYKHFGITAESAVAAAKRLLDA